MLLYYFNDKVHFSPGSERIPEVKDLKKEYNGVTLQHILRYFYFSYGRIKQNPYIGLPPVERRKSILIDHDLFPKERGKNEEFYLDLEEWPVVNRFLHKFLELHYTQLERQLIIIKQKIEKYQRQLASISSTADQEKEADTMLVLFNKRAKELEDAILREEEFGMNQPPALHLFELPDEVKKKYKEIGFSFN